MLKIAKEGSHYRVELFQVNRLNTLFSGIVQQQLRELVEESGVSVDFNLESVSFIDTSGFEVLMDIADRAKRHGSQFKLCNVSDDVRELIILLELEDRFTICICENIEEKILQVLD
ncbi:MAG: STAS domain-containing protein [Bacteroidales bacterium]|nr:STAS domain-containing protein [Bacteroidales bacterium]